MNVSFMKEPSAFLPLTMSLIALAMVLGHAAMFGVVLKPMKEPQPMSFSFAAGLTPQV